MAKAATHGLAGQIPVQIAEWFTPKPYDRLAPFASIPSFRRLTWARRNSAYPLSSKPPLASPKTAFAAFSSVAMKR
jgi:hypothetical protein